MWVRLLLIGLTFFFFVGSLLYPAWWQDFLFEGGFLRAEHWRWGLGWIQEHYLKPTLILLILVVVTVSLARNFGRNSVLASALRSAKSWVIGTGALVLLYILSACATVSLIYLKDRAQAQKRAWALQGVVFSRFLQEKEVAITLPPLTEPTSFIFLAKESIESLYSQYEPELIPAVVTEEIAATTELKAGVTIEKFLETEAGRNMLDKKLTEYQRQPKSIERKFKDLIGYLVEHEKLKRIGGFEAFSEEIRELNEAVETLAGKYRVTIDRPQLRVVRDKLLGLEIERFRADLLNLHGHLLVEGDWSAEDGNEAYFFRRALVDDVSDPPICEIKLSKNSIPQEYKEIIADLGNAPLRLSVFGNVISEMSNVSKTIRLKPIAIY